MALAYINSTNKADQIAVPAVMVPMNELHGRVRVFIDTATTAVGDAASTITFAKLPKGAKVLCGWLYGADETASITYSLGDGTTATKFINASTAFASGPAIEFWPAAALAGAALGFDMSEKSFVLTTGGAAMTGSAAVILVALYVVD